MSLIFFIISLSFSLLVFTKYRVYALYFLISHYFFIDLYNYYFGTEDLINFLSKSYREMLVFTLIGYLLININSFRNQYKSFLIILVLLLLFLIFGAGLNGFSNAMMDWRYTCAPILIALLLSMTNISTIDNLRKATKFLLCLTSLNSIFIIFQYLNFNGDYQNTWRYSFLVEQNLKLNSEYMIHMAQYQIVRGDQLRSSGVFLSALHAAYITSLAAVYSFIVMFNNKKIFYFILFFINVFALIYTQVRAGFLILVLSFMAFFSYYFYTKYKPKIIIGLSVLFTILFIILLFLNKDSLDDSIQGRIPQYLYLFDNFDFMGHGLGAYRGEFDSYYVNGFLTFGFAFGLWIFYILKKYVEIFSNIPALRDNFVILVYCSIIPALLFSLMQHFISSLYYAVIWLYLFGFIRYKDEFKSSN